MTQGSPSASRTRLHFAATALVLAGLVAAGCNHGDSKGITSPSTSTPSPTSLTGPGISASVTGVVTMTIPPESQAPSLRAGSTAPPDVVTGTFQPDGGGSVMLAGTYDRTANLVSISGGGYTFAGNVVRISNVPFISGGWTGPDGPGTFGCLEPSVAVPAAAYRGTMENGTAATVWNLALFLVGNSTWGEVAPTGGGNLVSVSGILSGPLDGRQVSLAAGYAQGGHDYLVTGSGVFGSDQSWVSGKWSLLEDLVATGDGGTWSVTMCPLQK